MKNRCAICLASFSVDDKFLIIYLIIFITLLKQIFDKLNNLYIAGSLVYTWGLEHFENAFKNNSKNPNSIKYPICINYLRNKNIIQ